MEEEWDNNINPNNKDKEHFIITTKVTRVQGVKVICLKRMLS